MCIKSIASHSSNPEAGMVESTRELSSTHTVAITSAPEIKTDHFEIERDRRYGVCYVYIVCMRGKKGKKGILGIFENNFCQLNTF